MPNYNTPGVFVEEISKLPASVAQVETAIPAFIGYTEKAEKDGEDLTLIPTRISSLVDYVSLFGTAPLPNPDGLIVAVTVVDGKVTEAKVDAFVPTPYIMYYQMQMYFTNGGGPCYIVSAGNTEGVYNTENTDLIKGLSKVAEIDEPTLIVFPDAVGLNDKTKFYNLYSTALLQCEALKDRFTIIDSLKSENLEANIVDLRAGVENNALQYGAAYFPHLKTGINPIYSDATVKVTGEGINGTLESIKESNNNAYNLAKAALSGLTLTLTPGAAVAGIYARVDSTRGVWKAPANVSMANVIKPIFTISDKEQGGLNIDPKTGKSINAIRSFTGKGVMVWGARTLAGNDNEWRYVSVRRLFNMVEESVKKTTAWAVFENNDANSWMKIKSQIENFLTSLWREGALAGTKPDEAFFVNVGLGTTMTPQDILEGKMNVEIGMASVRPAEFIILKFSHMLQQS